MAFLTTEWKTLGPDRMFTSRTAPSRITAWALMMPLTPSAPRGTSGRTWVGQLAAMSALTGLGRASGAGAGVGAGGAMTGGSAGGVAVDAAMTGALTGGAMSGGGT